MVDGFNWPVVFENMLDRFDWSDEMLWLILIGTQKRVHCQQPRGPTSLPTVCQATTFNATAHLSF